jgi:hypothetical protein
MKNHKDNSDEQNDQTLLATSVDQPGSDQLLPTVPDSVDTVHSCGDGDGGVLPIPTEERVVKNKLGHFIGLIFDDPFPFGKKLDTTQVDNPEQTVQTWNEVDPLNSDTWAHESDKVLTVDKNGQFKIGVFVESGGCFQYNLDFEPFDCFPVDDEFPIAWAKLLCPDRIMRKFKQFNNM